MIQEIVGIAMENDGLAFNLAGVTATLIRELHEYQGVRIHLNDVAGGACHRDIH